MRGCEATKVGKCESEYFGGFGLLVGQKKLFEDATLDFRSL